MIAIIAILASMLLPALGMAREKARRIICLANQKNIYLSTAIFADDHDNYLPGGGDSGPHPGTLRVNPFTLKAMWTGIFDGNQYTWGESLLSNYMGIGLDSNNNPRESNTILRCPSGGGRVEEYGTSTSVYNGLRTHYCMPGMSTLESPYTTPFALARTTKLWEKSYSGMPRIFIYDAAVYDATPGGDPSIAPTFFPRSPHMNGPTCAGMNITTTDGAGRWLNISECRLLRWGFWIYYSRVFPRDYEILFQEHRNYGSMRQGGNAYSDPLRDIRGALVTYGSVNTYSQSLSNNAMGDYFGYSDP